MIVTLIREDNFISVDGLGFTIDCSSLPADVHAIQWGGDHGEIEYSPVRCDHCGARTKKGNEWITDFTPYEFLIAAWRAAKEKHDAEKAERKRQEQVLKEKHEAEMARRQQEKEAAAEAERERVNAAGQQG